MRHLFVVALALLAAPALAKPSSPPLPSHVDKVDSLELQLNTSELLRAQMAQQQAQTVADQAHGEVERLQGERRRIIESIAKRYRLDPERDHFDPKSLVIERAPPKADRKPSSPPTEKK